MRTCAMCSSVPATIPGGRRARNLTLSALAARRKTVENRGLDAIVFSIGVYKTVFKVQQNARGKKLSIRSNVIKIARRGARVVDWACLENK